MKGPTRMRDFDLNDPGILDQSLLPLARAEWPVQAVELADRREAARAAKDFQLADVLRSEIEDLGFRMEDTPKSMRLYVARR